MEIRKRGTKAQRTGPREGSEGQRGGVETSKDRNAVRREQYANDLEYAERIRQRERANYRSEHPKKACAFASGLLLAPTVKEVRRGDDPTLLYIGVYTMKQSAEALGKTMLGFKRWVKEGLIPPPVLTDANRGYLHYSVGELEAIRTELVRHEHEFSYFTTKHVSTIHRVWTSVQRYRSTGV